MTQAASASMKSLHVESSVKMQVKIRVWTMLTVATLVAWSSPGCARAASTEDRGTYALRATRLYIAPDRAPIDDGVVLVRDGRILAAGARKHVAQPRDVAGLAKDAGCDGGVLVAGFWNSHVHFIEPQFSDAAKQPADALAGSVTKMLTRYGFTTVVDIGSQLDNTLALRDRIDSGEVPGPRILTAGIPLYPENGIAFYLRDLPPDLLKQLPQPATVEAALAVVRANLDHGADATKLFVATPQGRGKIAYMAPDIARAAVEETHSRGKLVFAHPTNNQGVRIAIDAGVDVLAHTTFEDGPSIWPAEQTAAMIAHGMALIPTLKLWPYELNKVKLPPDVVERGISDAVEQVRGFAGAGGQVLFGTDVGYMTDYDTTDEFVYLARTLTPMQILATLTTAPATRWRDSERRGRVEPGMDADLIMLNGDPARDIRKFADVRCTIRSGRIIYSAASAASAATK